MLKTLLATKQKMSHAFVGNERVAVTMVEVGPCTVTHIKTMEKDGYWAVQLGFGKRRKKASKAMQGHLKNSTKNTFLPHIKEVRLTEEPTVKVGDTIKLSDIFLPGDTIQVTGVSKGKGFAGGVKRWGFSGGPKTHGQSDRHRAPGSIGQGTTPGRVHKGKKMAGRMGSDQVTIKNLKVVSIDPEANVMAIAGALPGAPGTLLMIKKLIGDMPEPVAEAPEVVAEAETLAPVEAVETVVEETTNE